MELRKSWKDSIYLQREELARMLREPLERLAERCVPVWGDREGLDGVLLEGFSAIPYCTFLYCLGIDGVQISDNVGTAGLVPEHFGRDRSARPYMKEALPVWGFLLSDAYISMQKQRPSLTALQIVRGGDGQPLGYLGADFDLRNLPVTAELYEEPGTWRQVRGDPAIRGSVFQQCRIDSTLDQNLEQALSILEELLTQRGVFQCVIHFSSSQATIWTIADPFRYRILDQEALSDPDICLVYPPRPYPADALIPMPDVARILEALRALRMADENIYLRMSSINIFNGMVSLTFSCDGTHYMRHDEFLEKGGRFWFGTGA
ncbi:MAG TPA: PDC sensor domain-containing protein [Thiobacillaceae bacterium]|nr:PDC sensor domain-containing protein [Thiobacillaceae bacterium]